MRLIVAEQRLLHMSTWKDPTLLAHHSSIYYELFSAYAATVRVGASVRWVLRQTPFNEVLITPKWTILIEETVRIHCSCALAIVNSSKSKTTPAFIQTRKLISEHADWLQKDYSQYLVEELCMLLSFVSRSAYESCSEGEACILSSRTPRWENKSCGTIT